MTISDEWLTPPELISSLGSFDLDPCTPEVMPWQTAAVRYTAMQDGLRCEWFGRVWMNPPYSDILPWMKRLSDHGNGYALVWSKTDTAAFQRYVFPTADSIFFFFGRLKFLMPNGGKKEKARFPSALIAYGDHNSEAIEQAHFKGQHVPLNRVGIVVAGYDTSWRLVLKTIFIRLNRPASLDELYEYVESLAPDKVHRNSHFKEKVRQQLQLHFTRKGKGLWHAKAE